MAGWRWELLTLIQFEVRNGLPLVGRNKPSFIFPPTTEINNKFILVVVQGAEDSFESGWRESRGGEEVGCDDHLLQAN